MNWAFGQTPKTTSQKLVLIALADRADEDGICWPSVDWITEKCAPINNETARRVLRELSKQGLVEKVRRRVRKDGTFSTWLLRLPIDHRALVPAGDLEWEDEATGQECPVGQRAPVPTPPGTGARADSLTEPKRENPDGFSSAVVERVVLHWIAQAPPLIAHKCEAVMGDKPTRQLVVKALKEHGYEDVVQAISNYAMVLGSDSHWLTQRWTMHLFFKQRNAFPMFLPEAEPLTNYRNRSNGHRDRGVTFDEILNGGANGSGTKPVQGLPRAA